MESEHLLFLVVVVMLRTYHCVRIIMSPFVGGDESQWWLTSQQTSQQFLPLLYSPTSTETEIKHPNFYWLYLSSFLCCVCLQLWSLPPPTPQWSPLLLSSTPGSRHQHLHSLSPTREPSTHPTSPCQCSQATEPTPHLKATEPTPHPKVTDHTPHPKVMDLTRHPKVTERSPCQRHPTTDNRSQQDLHQHIRKPVSVGFC